MNNMNNMNNTNERLCIINIEFINKNNGRLNYPNLSDVIKDEEEFYKYKLDNTYYSAFLNNMPIENIKIKSEILDKNIISCSTNNYIKQLLEERGYTFDRLYKSMYTGVYKEEGFKIEYNEMNNMNKESINTGNRCIGVQVVPIETRKIFAELQNYMINNGYYNMKIIK